MDTLFGIIGPVFWGLVVFSILVFVHEGGHFLAARACGVRVTEFFLGMPCRFNLHHVSRRIGTKFGVTPILIGGYAEICGMDPTSADAAPAVLVYVHRTGRATVAEIAAALEIEEDEALDACIQLMGWGALAGCGGEAGSWPNAYAAMPRDAAGNTVFDGRRFDRAHATAEGEPWDPPMGEQAFFERERARTYQGVGFWKRAGMLVAGVLVNIAVGFLFVVAAYSFIGVETIADVNVIGAVTAGSPAEAAGIAAGDAIVSVDGAETESWIDVVTALDAVEPGETVTLGVLDADGADAPREVSLALDADGMIGIEASRMTYRLDPLDSCRIAISNIVQTAQAVGKLLVPAHTMEVLDSSTSIVGISVMSSQAAAAGAATFLNFMGLISLSLGFMNLLPIPPLDGGKLLIEIIQAVIRRPVPLKVQNAISIAGVALFLMLFVYMLRADILRFL